jgi:hypothetical protein
MVVPPASAARVPALEIVGRIGAHEGHFEMRMRIDAAGHDVAAGGIEHLAALRFWPISVMTFSPTSPRSRTSAL